MRFTSLHLPLLVSNLVLCGDIHINFDPITLSSFSLCTYNTHFLSNDHILTETWINKSSIPSELANATPFCYTLLSYYHTTNNRNGDKTFGGGTVFLILDSISIIINPSHNYKFFECSSVTRKMPSSTLNVCNIYRPLTLTKNSQPISVFLDEFQTFISSADTTPHEILITGDFNIHLDDPLDSSSQ